MNDEEIVKEITDEIGKASDMMGLHGPIGGAWSILYFKGPKTQDDLKKEIKCSLSSISQALSLLEKTGMVYVSGKVGRKNVYSAELDVKKVKRKQMENALRFYVNPMYDLLSSRVSMIKDKELKDKVSNMKGFFGKMGFFLNIILKTPFGKEGKKQ
ncbi:hypothetical protein KY345_04915 [Candidatus Woesearchaeota archaeon]|nr:hypothetical protein [Candidatus Woesearchaeota archaeon]